jgi:hypothetical protein
VTTDLRFNAGVPCSPLDHPVGVGAVHPGCGQCPGLPRGRPEERTRFQLCVLDVFRDRFCRCKVKPYGLPLVALLDNPDGRLGGSGSPVWVSVSSRVIGGITHRLIGAGLRRRRVFAEPRGQRRGQNQIIMISRPPSLEGLVRASRPRGRCSAPQGVLLSGGVQTVNPCGQ